MMILSWIMCYYGGCKWWFSIFIISFTFISWHSFAKNFSFLPFLVLNVSKGTWILILYTVGYIPFFHFNSSVPNLVSGGLFHIRPVFEHRKSEVLPQPLHQPFLQRPVIPFTEEWYLETEMGALVMLLSWTELRNAPATLTHRLFL